MSDTDPMTEEDTASGGPADKPDTADTPDTLEQADTNVPTTDEDGTPVENPSGG